MKYTSLELSKKLAEVGFNQATDHFYTKGHDIAQSLPKSLFDKYCDNIEYSSYDILNDLCVKYVREVWGEDYNIGQFECWYYTNGVEKIPIGTSPGIVMRLLQQGKQDEAEQYIIDNSPLFNQKK